MHKKSAQFLASLALASLVLTAVGGVASASPRPTIPPAALKAPPLREPAA